LAWLPLITDDVLNSLSTTEQNQMTDPSSAADLAQIVSSVTSFVRGKVNSYQPNQVFIPYPPGMIPEETYGSAIAIARYKFLCHLPGTQLITKWREAENTEAYALLDDVASGKLIILSPATSSAPGGTIPQKKADTDGGEDYGGTYPFWQPQTPAWPYW
jgi:hypothetical protein